MILLVDEPTSGQAEDTDEQDKPRLLRPAGSQTQVWMEHCHLGTVQVIPADPGRHGHTTCYPHLTGARTIHSSSEVGFHFQKEEDCLLAGTTPERPEKCWDQVPSQQDPCTREAQQTHSPQRYRPVHDKMSPSREAEVTQPAQSKGCYCPRQLCLQPMHGD